MQGTRRRDTHCELAIRSAVHKQGLRYRVDWRVPGTRARADLAFASAQLLVFVDGCFWHGCPKHATWPKANAAWWREKIEGNIRRDRDATDRLRRAGWLVLRFWEHEDPQRAAMRIAATVARRRIKRLT
jgi:DNA mismatch endonuclease (patch repair protein)